MNDRAKILVTRPEPQGQEFARLVQRNTSADVIYAPIMEILPVGEVPHLQDFDAIVVTSARALDRIDQPPRKGFPAFCVGPQSAKSASMKGFHPTTGNGDVRGLAEVILKKGGQRKLLYLRGESIAQDLSGMLAPHGQTIEEAIVYRQSPLTIPKSVWQILEGCDVILPVFSPASARALCRQYPDNLRPPMIVALSEAVANGWSGSAKSKKVAPEPNAKNLTNLLKLLV